MKTNNFAARSTSFSLSITWIIDTNDTIIEETEKMLSIAKSFSNSWKKFHKGIP